MSPARIAYVDVLVLRGEGDGLQVLCLRRGPGGRSPGSWEAIHGHIDEGETAVATAIRELREEAGLVPRRLYNLSRVESFYRHTTNEVVLVPVFGALVTRREEVRLSGEHDAFEWLAPAFAAFVSREAEASISPEHDAYEWLPPGAARERMSWPRIRREITDAVRMIGRGEAGPLEDVLNTGKIGK